MTGLSLSLGLSSQAYAPPPPSGQTVILAVLAGQSNMEGRSTPDRVTLDVDVANVYQYVGCSTNGNYRTIQSDITPLLHVNGFNDVTAPADRLGPGEYLARQLLTDNPAATVLLVPCAQGSTAMVGGTTPLWAPGSPGGSLFENMIAQTNLAYTAAQARWPGATIQVLLHFNQGEQDAALSVSESAYLTALTSFISTARSRITGATSAPFIMCSMIPQLWTVGDANYNAAYAAINQAHVMASVNLTGVYYVKGQYPGSSADNLHYGPASFVRTQGLRMGAIYTDVTGPNVTTPNTFSSQTGQKLELALAGDDPWGHQTFHINGGTDASSFQISDPYLSPTLQWTSDGTGPTAGSYTVGVRARDGKGNFGPTTTFTITVAAEVSPTTFFTSSERGMVWDLSTLANLSQTIDGLTPVTTAGQSVGWVKDLSPNANHWIANANDTTRPTYQVDGNGKPYLSFDGSNDVLLAATPFVNGTSNVANTAIMGLFGAAQSATKTVLSTGSTTNANPFLCPFQSNGTAADLKIVGRNDAASQLATVPTLTGVLNSATHVLTAKANGGNNPASMRDAATRPTGGGTGSYTTTTPGSTMALPVTVTRSGLGANCAASPANFFNGHIYSGCVINRLLTDAEIKSAEDWTAARILTVTLP